MKSRFAAVLVALATPIPNLGFAGSGETEYLHSERASVRYVYCGGYVSKASSLMKPLGNASPQFEDFRMKAANVGAKLLVTSDLALRKEARNLEDDEFQSSLKAGETKAESDWVVVEQGGGIDAVNSIVNQMGACSILLQHQN